MTDNCRVQRWPVLAAALSVLAAVSACTSPTAPGQPTTSYTGTWIGTHTLTAMRGGYDPRVASRFPTVGHFRLTVAQSGTAVSGTLAIDGPVPSSTENGFFTPHTLPVMGDVGAPGELTLTGSVDFIDPRNPYAPAGSSVRLVEWRATRQRDTMTGHLHATVSGFYYAFNFPQTFEFSSDLAAQYSGSIPSAASR